MLDWIFLNAIKLEKLWCHLLTWLITRNVSIWLMKSRSSRISHKAWQMNFWKKLSQLINKMKSRSKRKRKRSRKIKSKKLPRSRDLQLRSWNAKLFYKKNSERRRNKTGCSPKKRKRKWPYNAELKRWTDKSKKNLLKFRSKGGSKQNKNESRILNAQRERLQEQQRLRSVKKNLQKKNPTAADEKAQETNRKQRRTNEYKKRREATQAE